MSDSKSSVKIMRMSSVRCGRKVLLCKISSTLQIIIRYFLKPKKAIGREGCVKDTAADGDTFRCFEIEAILMPDFHLVLLG